MRAARAQSAIAIWKTRFSELEKYRAKHGDCNVPQWQGKLGRWVKTQRAVYKKRKLCQERIDRLRNIGFEWSLKDDATVRTDQLTVADSINDEFIGDYDDVDEFTDMVNTEKDVPTPSYDLVDEFDDDNVDFDWE